MRQVRSEKAKKQVAMDSYHQYSSAGISCNWFDYSDSVLTNLVEIDAV